MTTLPSTSRPCDSCPEHGRFSEKVNSLQRQVDEIKAELRDSVKKTELTAVIDTIERDITTLKEDSANHYESSGNFQATLSRLEEMSRNLKEMIISNRDQTTLLMDKIDRMFDLIQNINLARASENRTPSPTPAPAPGADLSAQIRFMDKFVDFLKSNVVALITLLGIIVYLLTGDKSFLK